MKLNQDCVRDLLMYCEDNLTYESFLNVNSLTLKDYSTEDLIYTADKLDEADFIQCSIARGLIPKINIISITYQGHQFLDAIRDKTIWESAKSKASKIASVSLPILQQLATSLIKSKLGLS